MLRTNIPQDSFPCSMFKHRIQRMSRKKTTSAWWRSSLNTEHSKQSAAVQNRPCWHFPLENWVQQADAAHAQEDVHSTIHNIPMWRSRTNCRACLTRLLNQSANMERDMAKTNSTTQLAIWTCWDTAENQCITSSQKPASKWKMANDMKKKRKGLTSVKCVSLQNQVKKLDTFISHWTTSFQIVGARKQKLGAISTFGNAQCQFLWAYCFLIFQWYKAWDFMWMLVQLTCRFHSKNG